MAIETALKFLERLEKEDTLRTQLYVSKANSLEKLVQFAHGKGFVVSQDDMTTALNEYQEKFPKGTIEPLRQLPAGR
ncbi:MAG: Nif11 family protein [Anaerolineae bacterium]|nr:Nif11 family protein [Anaerolineae bacterium]MCA9889689.1 Nif11 family protein [Anaerolineae bacterium]MCA9892159.1 Nif11 family protein [Anaerolineae bacterium]MCB9460251.1 Nif11 family protein [Anaerolineaceae bacterium]